MRISGKLVLLVFFVCSLGYADESPDPKSVLVETRIRAMRLLSQGGETQVEPILRMFEAEPRVLRWESGQPSLRLEAIAAAENIPAGARLGLLKGFLDIELKAIREDVTGFYEKSQAFGAFLDACLQAMVRVGDAGTLGHLRSLLENRDAAYRAETCSRVFVAELQLADRLENRVEISKKVRHVLPNLTGRFWSKDDYQKRGVWKPEAVREYGTQAYLESLGPDALPPLVSFAEDASVSLARRLEVAYVGARVLVAGSAKAEKALSAASEEGASRLARLLAGVVDAKDSLYAPLAIKEVQSVSLEKMGDAFRRARQELDQKIEAAVKAKPPEEAGDIRKRLQEAEAKLDAELLAMRSDRDRELLSKLDAMAPQIAPKQASFIMECVAEKDPMVVLKAVGLVRRLAESDEGRQALDAESARLMVAFERQGANWMMLGPLANMVCTLSPARQKDIVAKLAKAENASQRAGATLIVRFGRTNELLSEINPLLLDKNSWVRRCAEEAYEDLGYRTWRGEVVGKIAPATQPASQPVAESNRTFQKDLADAVAASNVGNAEVVAALVERMSGTAAQSTLLEAVGDPKTDAKMKKLALRCLAANGSESAIDPVLRLVRESKNEEFLNAVAEAMGHLRNPQAIPLLIQAACDGTDSRLGGACSLAVARIPGEEPARALLKAYTKGVTDPGNREIIARGIAAISAPEAVGVLSAVAKDWTDDRLARAAVAGIGSVGTPEAATTLFQLAESNVVSGKADRLSAVEDALAIAVSQGQDNVKIVQSVIANLKSPHASIRLTAAKALGAAKQNEAALKALQDAAQGEADPAVLSAIQASITRLNKKEG